MFSRRTTDCKLDWTYHGGDGEFSLGEVFGEPVDLPARVAEDDRLRDRHRLVQVAQRLQLPRLKHKTNTIMLPVLPVPVECFQTLCGTVPRAIEVTDGKKCPATSPIARGHMLSLPLTAETDY